MSDPVPRLVPRPEPEIVIRIPLEGAATVHLHADTAEDERRLRLWLASSPAVFRLVEDALDLAGREAA